MTLHITRVTLTYRSPPLPMRIWVYVLQPGKELSPYQRPQPQQNPAVEEG
ncbi:hypothetical protein [Acetobacter malorum]|nr:hypothetical protein [Acetobacter malorum]